MVRIRYWLCPGLVVLTWALIFADQIQAQSSDSKAKPAGSISGRVTVGEKPLPGIAVIATALGSTTPNAQATSDADGNYRLNGLRAGQLVVVPAAPLYVLPASSFYSPGRVINLAPNEVVDNIDFKLTRGGVITGRITDADGRPVIEERVTPTQVDDNGAPTRGIPFRPTNTSMYSTDDRGIYRLYGLPPGHYKVSVGDDVNRGAGLMRGAGYFPRVYYPDATDGAKAAIVDVTSGGETKNIDIKVGRRTTTYAVSGRIIDTDSNRPLPGVYFSIGVVQKNQNQSYLSGSSGPGSPTNSAGEFRMEGLSPGQYAVLINQDYGRFNGSPTANVFSDPLTFEIVDGDVTNLEVKAQRGHSISGVIIPDNITDRNILARMSKLTLSVFVNPPQHIQTYTTVESSPINPDGGFLIDGLRPGKVTLNLGVNPTDAVGFNLARIELDGVVLPRVIDLPPGQDISGLRVHVTYGTGVIRGLVKSEGAPLPSDSLFTVTVMRPGEGERFGDQVDSRGRFLVKGVPPGTYEVTLQTISLGSQTGMLRTFPRPLKQTITVTDGAETEVTFTLDLTKKEGP